MPGYLAEPSSNAAGVSIIPSGNLSSSNIQSAIYELDSEKADGISVNNSLNTKAPINNPTLTGTTVMTTASVANNLTVNGNTLFVDTVNNRVGIGNNSLTSQLHIKQQSGINDAIYVEGYNGGGAKIYRKESDGSIRFDAIQQGFSDIVFSTTPNSGTITERMKIDSSGRVTKTSQPYFRTYANTATAVGNVINYNVTINNIGNHYDITNKRFTAPINGIYFFEAHYLSDRTTGTGDTGFDFRVNASSIKRVYDQKSSTTNNHTEARGTLIISLNANDYVDIFCYGNAGGAQVIANYTHCQFAGYLLG